MEPPLSCEEPAGYIAPLLGQAAMSHIELAVMNISSQAHSLHQRDWAVLRRLVQQLQEIAPAQLEPMQKRALSVCTPTFESQSHTAMVDFEARHVTSAQRWLVPDACLAAPPPAQEALPVLVEDAGAALQRTVSKSSQNGPELQRTASQSSQIGRGEATQGDLTESLQHWLVQLMDVFDQIDINKTGSVDFVEWEQALSTAKVPLELSTNLFNFVDEDKSGSIDRTEWLAILQSVQTGSCPDLFVKFSESLSKLQAKNGRIYLKRPRPHYSCILRPESPVRMSWDLLMAVFLCYIALMLPYTLGFLPDGDDTLRRIDTVIDGFFMIDVILNFRTAYYLHEVLITSGRRIAISYLTSWFLLDFLTCFPFDLVTAGFLPSLQPGKLLKILRVLKVLKLLRIGKLKRRLQNNEFMNNIEEYFMSAYSQSLLSLLRISLALCLMCHWLSCFMGASGSDWNLASSGGTLNYSTAMYWAMQTLTTVGYGDIYALGFVERWYATLAMVLGGAFYGYMIGMISVSIATMDRNAAAYTERLSQVQAWLCHHTELPKRLRCRVKRYFEKHLTQKAAVEDTAIINDLSPALYQEVSFYLINDHVRCCAIFHDLPNSALAHLLPILEHKGSDALDYIVTCGDPGNAMYIIVDGKACFEQGHQWKAHDPLEDADEDDTKLLKRVVKQSLGIGDSFGEEIILGLEEEYNYTILAISQLELYTISEASFKQIFCHMPDMMHKMMGNFVRNHAPDADRLKKLHGRSSLLLKHGTVLPPAFPDVVLDSLYDISMSCNATEKKLGGVPSTWQSERTGGGVFEWQDVSERSGSLGERIAALRDPKILDL